MKNSNKNQRRYMRILYSCAFAYAFSLPMWAEKPMLETEIAEQSKGIRLKERFLMKVDCLLSGPILW